MMLNEYLNGRNQNDSDVLKDLEKVLQAQAEQQSQIDDLADTLETLMTEVIPND